MHQPVNIVEEFVESLFRLPTEEKLRIINALQATSKDDGISLKEQKPEGVIKASFD